MKIVIYSVVLNQHQAPVADELWELTEHQFTFVELINLDDRKGGCEDYSTRPYLLRAWESSAQYEKAMNLARTAECCIFSGVDSLPYEKERMRLGLLSFDMGERWLKHGWKSLASPRLQKWLAAYYFGGWKHKPLYKLCMSGFAAEDHYKLGTFKNKAYKWGYFTKVNDSVICKDNNWRFSNQDVTHLMWCARFLKLKHPELPILMADILRNEDYQFHIDMYGDGEYFNATDDLIKALNLEEYVILHGNVPNENVRKSMRESDIFLFTSDKNEGWGAVANESMSCGCVLVSSDEIGSTPYLIADGKNGFRFKTPSTVSSFNNPDTVALLDMTDIVKHLLDDKEKLNQMAHNAFCSIHDLWNPKHAAISLLQLIEDLKTEKQTSIIEGPCSIA